MPSRCNGFPRVLSSGRLRTAPSRGSKRRRCEPNECAEGWSLRVRWRCPALRGVSLYQFIYNDKTADPSKPTGCAKSGLPWALCWRRCPGGRSSEFAPTGLLEGRSICSARSCSRAKKIVSIPSILVGIPTNFPDGRYGERSHCCVAKRRIRLKNKHELGETAHLLRAMTTDTAPFRSTLVKTAVKSLYRIRQPVIPRRAKTKCACLAQNLDD